MSFAANVKHQHTKLKNIPLQSHLIHSQITTLKANEEHIKNEKVKIEWPTL